MPLAVTIQIRSDNS